MEFLSLKPGRSVEGDEIPCFRSENKASNYVYLVAGTHGDEVEGVYVLQQLFDWLKEDEDVNLPFIILPISNTSSERLAIYISYEIRKKVKERFSFTFPKLEVEVEETPGQSAVFVLEEND